MILLAGLAWVASLAFAYWLGRSDERIDQAERGIHETLDRLIKGARGKR